MDPARHDPPPERPVGALFIVFLALAWCSGLLYLVVRTRLPIAIDLAVVDTLHVYVGVASLAFLASLVATGQLPKIDAPGGPAWIGGSLLVLYLALYISGGMLLLPLAAWIREPLVTAHLLSAVWSAPPTTMYVWRSRSRFGQFFGGSLKRVPLGFWLAVAVVLLPAAALALMPRSLSPLAQTGTGGVWSPVGPRGIFLDRLAVSSKGERIVAGGEGLYLAEMGGSWRRLDFPPELVLGLALSAGPTEAYVGTTSGIYAAGRVDGPYRKLSFPGHEVHGIAIDPRAPRTIWLSSREGFWRSDDAGEHWTNASRGLEDPEGSWALGYFRGVLYGSAGLGVYRWTGPDWELSSKQKYVVSLDPSADGERLFAASMGAGIQVFDGRRWRPVDEGLAAHRGDAIHVVSVTAGNERAVAATMLDGVAISNDGETWSGLGAGLSRGTVWRVLDDHGWLLAASDDGLFSYTVNRRDPTGAWWILFAGALSVGTLGSFSRLRAADESGQGAQRRRAQRPPAPP
jgi:hypothetical protein